MAKKTVDFTPVDCGDMSEIPPDAPPGEWTALCSVKKSATSKDNFPMLILDWTLEKAWDEGNESFVGARVSDFVVFFPANHKACKMSRVRLKELCAGLKIDPPAVAKITSWDDVAEFVDALDGCRADITTRSEEDKKNGGTRTALSYTTSGGGSADEEDEDEDEEAPPPKKTTKVAKKKTKTAASA